MGVERRPDPAETNRDETSPVPPDAPVETPEADPRTEGAPDGVEPRSTPDQSKQPDPTEEDIREAFE